MSASSTTLLRDLHIKYIRSLDEKQDTFEYHITQHLKLNGIYWGLTALHLLGQPDALDREAVVAFLKSCQHPNGGFGGNVDHDPHIIYTLSAVQVLVMYDRLDEVDTDKIVSYAQGLQKPDGSFAGDQWGEIDTRFSFIALACLSLLGRLDAVDVDKAVEFVLRCRNFDGGFGSLPGSESHAGQVFCCVGALAIVDRLHLVDQDLLAWWLAERQVPAGGLNGRPEKKEDWCLSVLKIINRVHWINRDKLIQFILSSQDDEVGGIADRVGDVADVYHTCFGIAGLALLGYEGLGDVDPIYCMPKEIIARRGLGRPFLIQ